MLIQRWSAAPIIDPSASDSDGLDEENQVIRRHPSGPRFARSGARVSMQIFGGGNGTGQSTGYRWAEAADNVLLSSAVGSSTAGPIVTPPDYEETMHRRTRSLRREPVGATSESLPPLNDGHSSTTTSSTTANSMVLIAYIQFFCNSFFWFNH